MDMDIMSTLFKLAEKYSFGDKLLTSFQDSLASGLSFGVSGTRRQMRKQQQYALEQMQVQQGYALEQMAEQQRLNREQYDYEYSMESPSARVQQLRSAGLNSGLMYGSGAGGAGMQGSVGTVSTPSGPSAHGPSASGFESSLASLMMATKENALLDSEIEANKALANERNASAKQKLGDTEPQKVDMELKRYNMKLYDSYVSLNGQLAQESNERERVHRLTTDLLGFQKEAQQHVFSIKSTDPQGNPIAFQLAGKFVSVYGEALNVGRELSKLHLDGKILANYQREVNASIAETLASAFNLRQIGGINEAKKYMEVFRTNVLLYLQENSGTVGQSIKKELEAGIERLDRYMDKEFDGSTTEWLMGCMQAISGGAVTAASVYAAGRNGNQKSITINNHIPYRH